MNPGIIEVTEGDETQRHRKMNRKDHQEPPKDREPSVATKSSFLDDLRIQTHRKLGSGPSPPPESLQTMNAKLVMHEGSLETLNGTVDKSHPLLSKASGDDDDTATVVVKPRGMRDLNARSNFDPRLTDEYFGSKSFKDVGASEEVIKALTSLQVTRPSAIQAMAFKPVLEGQSCIVADQTGSGKTLAYVAPLVQSLRNEEANGAAKALSKKPHVLVLVPTSELAVQVLNVCRAVSKGGAPFRSIILTGGFKWKTQVESLVQGAEIVVATPGRFLQHLQSGTLQLNNLKCVVLDEVDILYDDEEFLEVLQTVEQAAAKHVQYVHVTATLPVDIHDSLLSRYPDSVPLMGPSLHRTAVGLQEILVDCSGAEGEEKTPEAAFVSKRTALLQLVDERPVSKTIVFCNKIETCRKVENALARHDRNETKLVVLPYHAALSQQARLESMQQFLESKPKKDMFLVCTDR
jgi:ATP-dependent RNA helicase DDX18/HAS1